MATEEQFTFEGVILRTIPYRDTDLICRVLTPLQGKCALIAYGCRKEQSKLQIHFELFDCGIFRTAQGRGSLSVLKGFRPMTSFRALREDLDKYIISSCVAESFDNLVHEDADKHMSEFYEACVLGLRAISDAASLSEVLKASYLSLNAALQIGGFASNEDPQTPSTQTLVKTLHNVMHATDRELNSYPSVIDVLKRYSFSQKVALAS